MIEEREDFIALLKEKSYRKGDFKLSSGKKSEHYINCKPATLQSDALLFISWCILECLEEDTVAVGGLTLVGGVERMISADDTAFKKSSMIDTTRKLHIFMV